jgi:hypothetical protein
MSVGLVYPKWNSFRSFTEGRLMVISDDATASCSAQQQREATSKLDSDLLNRGESEKGDRKSEEKVWSDRRACARFSRSQPRFEMSLQKQLFFLDVKM